VIVIVIVVLVLVFVAVVVSMKKNKSGTSTTPLRGSQEVSFDNPMCVEEASSESRHRRPHTSFLCLPLPQSLT
jgi:septal ring-binding cell division protein DamX